MSTSIAPSLQKVNEQYLELINLLCQLPCDPENPSAITRQEHIFCIRDGNPCEDPVKNANEFVRMMDDLIQIVKKKKDDAPIKSSKFFENLCRVMDKKGAWMGKTFIFTDDAARDSINIGVVATGSTAKTSLAIRNILYTMYLSSCEDLGIEAQYGEEVRAALADTPVVAERSRGELNELMDDVLQELSKDGIVPPAGLDISNIMNDVISSVYNNASFADLKEELNTTSKDEIIGIVRNVKEKLAGIDVAELMGKVDLNDIEGSMKRLKEDFNL